MRKLNKLMATLLALVLCLSLLPMAAFAAEGDTLSDELLKPGKEDIIDPAKQNGQNLIDGTYNALNPTDPDADPSPVPAEGKDVSDIVDKDEEGKVNGGVLNQADDAKTNAANTKDDVDAALTVGEGEDAKSVNEAVKAETDKADKALADAKEAAADAAKAVEARDQKALDKAKAAAKEAAEAAEDAYNEAQAIFDNAINNVLKGEDGTVSEETKADINARAGALLAEQGVMPVEEPGENATEEQKAAYEAYVSAKVSAENAAKAAVANAKIAEMYGDANSQIEAAQAALSNAKEALETAKNSYDTAVAKANVLNEGTSSDIEAYVKFFNGLTADNETATKVSEAYNDLDTKTSEAATKKGEADQAEEGVSDKVHKSSPAERILRDATWDKAPLLGTDVKTANTTVNQAVEFVLAQYEIITSGTASQEEIDAAKSKLFDEKMDKWWDFADLDDSDSNAIKVIEHRLNRVPAQRTKLTRLVTNLKAEQAVYEQEKAQKALNETLAGLTDGLDYQKALEVVKALAGDQFKNRDELKDAADKLAAQQKAAEDAAQKVADATAAYNAALAAVQQALDGLEQAKLSNDAMAAQQKKLNDALANLEQAKKDKEAAVDAKKAADDAVIRTITEITDGDDTGIDIADDLVPLAGPVMIEDVLEVLYKFEGSPDGADPEGEFELAIAWGIANDLIDEDTDPEEIVTGAILKDILTRYAAAFDGNVVEVAALTTLVTPDEDIVDNCGEVLAEFLGVEYTPAEEEAA